MTSRPDFYSIPLAQEEYDAVVEEAADRLTNLAYAVAHVKIREALAQCGILPQHSLQYIKGVDNIRITMELVLIGNDIAEIVAGMRRRAEIVAGMRRREAK